MGAWTLGRIDGFGITTAGRFLRELTADRTDVDPEAKAIGIADLMDDEPGG